MGANVTGAWEIGECGIIKFVVIFWKYVLG